MASRLDTYIPDYAYNVPVTTGTVWYGPIVSLQNAAGLSFQIQTLGGASGSLAYCPTNFAGIPPLWTAPGNMPIFTAAGTTSVGVNNTAATAFNVNTSQAYFHSIYFYFSPTASGSIYVAVNVRRFGD